MTRFFLELVSFRKQWSILENIYSYSSSYTNTMIKRYWFYRKRFLLQIISFDYFVHQTNVKKSFNFSYT